MPRRKQLVQKQRRQKVYRAGELSGEATHLEKKGFFRVFGNYKVFAIGGAILIGGGVILSAVTAGGTNRTSTGRIPSSEIIRRTPEAGETATTDPELGYKQYAAPPALVDAATGTPFLDPTKRYTATIKTAKGDVKVELMADEAEQTVANFVFLAGEKFYDGVTFHYVVPDFVAQTGDPSGTGSGGPGYDLPVEATDLPVQAGSLVMAKPEAAGTQNNGSQFFFVLSDDYNTNLSGKYTVFGKVTSGLELLQALTARNVGDDATGDEIESITIQSS